MALTWTQIATHRMLRPESCMSRVSGNGLVLPKVRYSELTFTDLRLEASLPRYRRTCDRWAGLPSACLTGP